MLLLKCFPNYVGKHNHCLDYVHRHFSSITFSASTECELFFPVLNQELDFNQQLPVPKKKLNYSPRVSWKRFSYNVDSKHNLGKFPGDRVGSNSNDQSVTGGTVH